MTPDKVKGRCKNCELTLGKHLIGFDVHGNMIYHCPPKLPTLSVYEDEGDEVSKGDAIVASKIDKPSSEPSNFEQMLKSGEELYSGIIGKELMSGILALVDKDYIKKQKVLHAWEIAYSETLLCDDKSPQARAILNEFKHRIGLDVVVKP